MPLFANVTDPTVLPFIHTGLKLTLFLIAVIALTILFEGIYIRRKGGTYNYKEGAASVFISAGHHTTNFLFAGVWGWAFFIVWTHRLWTVPVNTWWGFALLFLGEEFFYYWSHRLCHEIRWFWASHSVHHSPKNITFSTALRLGWSEGLTGLGLIYLPMVLLGFAPDAVFTVLGANLIYQIWVHTEIIPKLGWIDYVFNTPYNHRVHHAYNKECIDKNYGGVIMLFDHLFGTYVYEHPKEKFVYGVPGMENTGNPIYVILHQWRQLFRNAWKKPGIGGKLRYLFLPYGQPKEYRL